MILYEYPFNERIRTYLRLERLADRLGQLSAQESALSHHFALHTLFELLEVGARSDLKTEILKDLERLKQQYLGYRGNPAISEAALEAFIARLEAQYAALQECGKIGQSLADNEWLAAVRSRIAIPGGTCEFDLPAYHDWQHRSPDQRQQELQLWAQSLAPLLDPVQVLLSVLRESAHPQKVMALGGQFQQNLAQGKTYQLLRLWIDPALQLVPEISGNRMFFAVRLLQWGSSGKPQLASTSEAELEFTLCA
ncbi:cell division protein ZapD [Serpentinimonas barnesii]|uniref:cell division protein ZapD n=1 Tax=Serpentinimonas barnesii TaxID=1458427 RepID=UPI000494E483|nr:cell division protein ZapD [Serpentinimonas barnesii]